jgi:hypothetical protein
LMNCRTRNKVCQIFLGTTFKSWTKYTKSTQNEPYGLKTYKLTVKLTPNGLKYTNFLHVHNKTLQNLSKIGFLVWKYTIWQSCPEWLSDGLFTVGIQLF